MPQTQRLSEKQFYLTPVHDCSYLPEESARTLFLDPEDPVDPATYTALTHAGFRRSGAHLYRPYCDNCAACIPARIPVAEFRPRRSQRRIRARNRDLDLAEESPSCSREYYRLYSRYIEARHGDGDMYPPSHEQFRAFLTSGWSDTRFLTLRLEGTLLAVAVLDRLPDGVSAIYTFFDPELPRRALGVYSILAQIDYCRARSLDYLYLGYWIRGCRKMAYKTDYRPIELLMRHRWVRLN